MMRRRIDDVALSDVARWRLRRAVLLPVPLSGGAVDDVEVAAIEVGSQAGAGRALTALDRAGPLLTSPEWCVWAGRVSPGAGRTLLLVGLVRGDDALLVAETADRWRLQQVPATALVEVLVAQLPPLRPAPMEPVEVSTRSLREAGERRGRAGEASGHLVSRGLGGAAAALLERVDSDVTASGILGGMAFDERGVALPVEEEARWFESPAGSILTSAGADGRTRVSAASAAGLRSTVARLAEDARRPLTRATKASSSVTRGTAGEPPATAVPRWADHAMSGPLGTRLGTDRYHRDQQRAGAGRRSPAAVTEGNGDTRTPGPEIPAPAADR